MEKAKDYEGFMSMDGAPMNGGQFGEDVTALADTFTPAVAYHDWERDPTWQHFLKQQQKFDRPRTQRVNELMYSVPDGTRKEFLRRINRASKCDNAIDFERHSLGVAFTMQRLSLMMTRRKKTMRLSSESLKIQDLEGFMGYADEDTPLRARNLTIVDNFTIYKDEQPFIYKAKYTPVRQFGEIDKDNKDPHFDRNQLLKYNEAIKKGLICGAAVEIRGLISPEFLDWACGTDVFERSDIPHVQLIYNMPLPSGAEYRFTFKKTVYLEEELMIENDPSQFTQEDLEVIKGIENALSSGNQFQLTEIMSGEGVFKDKGSLTQQFQSFACPAKEDQLKDPEYYDNYLAMMRLGIWRRASMIRPEIYNHNVDTILAVENKGIENDYDAITARIEEFQAEVNSKNKAYYLGEQGTAEYDARAQAVTERVAARLQSIRENIPQEISQVPEGCYALSVSTIIKDCVIETLLTEKGITPKRLQLGEQQEARLSIDDLISTLDERKESEMIDVMEFDPLTSGGKKLKIFPALDMQAAAKKQQIAIRTNLSRFKKHVEKRMLKPSEKPRFAEHREEINALEFETKENRKRLTDITSKRVKSARGETKFLKENILRNEAKLFSLVEECLDPSTQESMFIGTKLENKNRLRFIYVVDRNNQITLMEETKSQSKSKNRYNHGDLNDDGMVKGAGEVILEKPIGSEEWQIIEINNGSGHYRPPSDTLRQVKTCLVESLFSAYQENGMSPDDAVAEMRRMMSKAQRTDTIARGITLPLEIDALNHRADKRVGISVAVTDTMKRGGARL
jgi:hypothetical protein